MRGCNMEDFPAGSTRVNIQVQPCLYSGTGFKYEEALNTLFVTFLQSGVNLFCVAAKISHLANENHQVMH